MRNESIETLITELKKLKVREARIIALLERETTRAVADGTATTDIAVGDRVYIKNRLRKPSNWDDTVPWDERVARHATVTSIEPGKVHFVTDNGVRTWRLSRNLTRL